MYKVKTLLILCSLTFPDVPDSVPVSHMEVQGTHIVSLERLALADTQIQSLTIANNKLQHVSERAFR